MRKNSITQRLNIIKGQITGITNLLEQKEDCKNVIIQLNAVNTAFKRVIELYLQDNLECCLNKIDLKNKETINVLLKTLIKQG
jgi:DNA-binding FrmR family transcriptional regulator